jgi:hypothetical protein
MKPVSEDIILLRAFAASVDENAAITVSRTVEEILRSQGKVLRCDSPKRYWKIAEYWEIFFVLQPDRSIQVAFEELLNELGTGWEVHKLDSDSWAVWNSGPVCTFASGDVRWANLECVSRDASESVIPQVEE